jgi:hypothetical protein
MRGCFELSESLTIESQLSEALGVSFLAHVLNIDAQSMELRLNGQTPLSAVQEQILAELAQLLQTRPRGHPYLALRHIADTLGTYSANHGSSLATWLRKRAGGIVFTFDSNDPVAATLIRIIRDIYPLFLLPLLNEPPAWAGRS